MKYLFDTDILSELMRRAPSLALVRRFAAVPTEDQATSSITLGELVYGATRLGPAGARLRARIGELVEANLPVLPFDQAAAREYGILRATLEAAGTPIGDADTRIAAIALSHRLIVVTRNTRHFEMVPGVVVENWLDA